MKWNFRFVSGGTQNLCGLFNAFTVLFYEFFFWANQSSEINYSCSGYNYPGDFFLLVWPTVFYLPQKLIKNYAAVGFVRSQKKHCYPSAYACLTNCVPTEWNFKVFECTVSTFHFLLHEQVLKYYTLRLKELQKNFKLIFMYVWKLVTLFKYNLTV